MSFKFKPIKRQSINIDCGNKIVFVLLGMGGANSYLAYELAQIASLSDKRTDIVMVDSSNVTKENIITEKFTNKDLGKNKAEVTASRCASSFDIEIEVYDKEIESKEDIIKIFEGRMGYFPIIICNDMDMKTYKCLNGAMESISDAVILTGNLSYSYGDITLSYRENGVYKTTDFLAGYNTYSQGEYSKPLLLEASRNMFLFLDDIICEKSINVEKVTFNSAIKTCSSKYIGEDESYAEDVITNKLDVRTSDNILCIVIGVGGTGGTVAYEVAHLASFAPKNMKLVFIDGDIIESKNLNRQRFIVQDLNKYKSDVTARRCKNAYGVDIKSVNEYITDAEDIYSLIRTHKEYTPIILGCSDSLKLRYLVCEAIKNAKDLSDMPKDIIYIDAGNGEHYGQVIFTYIKDGKYITPDYFTDSPQSLEDVYKAKLVTQLSCDELMNSAPQTKGANMSTAVNIYSYLHDVIYDNPIMKYKSEFNNVSRRLTSVNIK